MAATAEEILSWADVPRKKAELMVGYQRALGDRHEKITEFIEKSSENIIPGAVIVAIPEEALEIEGLADEGVYRLTVQVPGRDFDEQLTFLHDRLRARLSQSELESIEASDVATATEEDLDENEMDTPLEEVPPESYLATVVSELGQACEDFASLAMERQAAVKQFVESMSRPGRILDGSTECSERRMSLSLTSRCRSYSSLGSVTRNRFSTSMY